MKIAMFVHSLLSDWNHGNAHFLRGVASDLVERGHEVCAFEAHGAWSLSNLINDQGPAAVDGFHRAYPHLKSVSYDAEAGGLPEGLDGVDLILVHEWNPPSVVRRLGEYRRDHPRCRLFFHDTHHRMITKPHEMRRYDLTHYDGVLAFGKTITDLYLSRGFSRRAWTWHEAADIRRFHPRPSLRKEEDLVWVGNWGDEERTREIEEFLIAPAHALGLRAAVHGVRYPEAATRRLSEAGIQYRGWIANFHVPEVFAKAKVTVHIPRRPYVQSLPGIPTIRMFEALACGVPLISAPWTDSEGLFEAGRDYLVARDGKEMRRHLDFLLHNPEFAQQMARQGVQTIRAKHTCTHRVDQLLAIHADLTDVLQDEKGGRSCGGR